MAHSVGMSWGIGRTPSADSRVELAFAVVDLHSALVSASSGGECHPAAGDCDGDTVARVRGAVAELASAAAGFPRRDRAVVDQWMDWASTELNTAWRYAFLALSRRDPRFADATQIEHSVAEWNRHMQMLEGHLRNGTDHVAGDGFTLADIVLGLATNRWQSTPMLRPELPAVDAWMARLAERAGYRAFCGNGLP